MDQFEEKLQEERVTLKKKVEQMEKEFAIFGDLDKLRVDAEEKKKVSKYIASPVQRRLVDIISLVLIMVRLVNIVSPIQKLNKMLVEFHKFLKVDAANTLACSLNLIIFKCLLWSAIVLRRNFRTFNTTPPLCLVKKLQNFQHNSSTLSCEETSKHSI